MLILASVSKTRAEMLQRAGLTIRCDPAEIDEAALKDTARAMALDTVETALALALAKAEAVAKRHPRALVLGADQLLECDGVWFAKARDRSEARASLLALSGRAHRLISAAVIVRDGVRRWQTADTATLTAWSFGTAFVDHYLEQIGDDALTTVGAYKIEGPGVRLFEKIDGDHFTILGLPLLPLLAFLRDARLIEG